MAHTLTNHHHHMGHCEVRITTGDGVVVIIVIKFYRRRPVFL